MKAKAHIDNWTEFNAFPYGTVLVGTVKDHARQGEFHTHSQQTSRIIAIDREKGFAETQNTIYTLGKEIKYGTAD